MLACISTNAVPSNTTILFFHSSVNGYCVYLSLPTVTDIIPHFDIYATFVWKLFFHIYLQQIPRSVKNCQVICYLYLIFEVHLDCFQSVVFTYIFPATTYEIQFSCNSLIVTIVYYIHLSGFTVATHCGFFVFSIKTVTLITFCVFIKCFINN